MKINNSIYTIDSNANFASEFLSVYIKDNNINHYINKQSVTEAFLNTLKLWKDSKNKSLNNLSTTIFLTPKKMNKFINKLVDTMSIQSFVVNSNKEEYKKKYPNSARIYANKVHRLHSDPIAKKIMDVLGYKLFKVIPESKYLAFEYTKNIKKNLNSYPLAYEFSAFSMSMLRNVLGTSKITVSKKNLTIIKEIDSALKLKKLNGRNFKRFINKSKEDNYFKVKTDIYLQLLEDKKFDLIFNSSDSETQSVKTLMANFLFYNENGYCYFNNMSKEEIKYLKNNNRYTPFDFYGRRYTVLNSIKKSIRNKIFEGKYETDIDSSCVMVFLNTYFKDTLKVNIDETNVAYQIKEKFPCLFEYITNKKIVRYRISDALVNFTYDDVKTLITSLIFDPNRRIVLEFKSKRDSQVNYLIDLVAELRALSKAVEYKIFHSTDDEESKNYKFGKYRIKEIREIVKEDIRINKFKNPKNYGKGKKYFGKRLFRFYAIVENEIRQHMMEYANLIGTDCNQLHDCIFTSDKLDSTDLTRYIKHKTGFLITFSTKKL